MTPVKAIRVGVGFKKLWPCQNLETLASLEPVIFKLCAITSDSVKKRGLTLWLMGGSPGLVVMGGDSRSEGRGFESLHLILDGHLSHIFVVKICNVL